ncbi:hypothetical protein FAUST_10784 [Fusarium austroamericanum]|uniref:DUF7580 domain-containing protein n=1 Tax=Fusarium austroamericanum TaxID=282268 RepID=A0AAN5Z0Z2_FUSAU|nr:hypothetical protein FAUST_10784 [Fusarium austroamericanum]
MSGFEVVGVVLGSIPLLISGLEHYRNGIETIGNMVQYVEVVENILTSISTTLSIYRQSCEILLQGLILPENILDELLNSSGSTAWADKQLVEQLKKQFGPHREYKVYRAAVVRLNKRIEKLRSKLDLDEDFQPKWIRFDSVDANLLDKFFHSGRELRRRVKIGFNGDRYMELADAIESDVTRISALIGGARTLEPIRTDRESKEAARHWLRFGEYAQRVFTSLSSRWSGTCQCQFTHVASLPVDIVDVSDIHLSTSLEPKFEILCSFEYHETSIIESPWKWKLLEIEPKLARAPVSTTAHSNIAPLAIDSGYPLSSIPAINVIAPQHTSVVHPRISATFTTGPISDLCDVLSKATCSSKCLGFLHDENWEHQLNLIDPRDELKRKDGFSSLGDILGKTEVMGTKTKFGIAASLASAVLQFHATAWLSDHWDSTDIYFLSGRDNKVQTDRPYISKRFAHQECIPPSSKRRVPSVSNEMTFALGTALIELSYSKRLLDFQEPGDLDENGNVDILTRLEIAKRLVGKLETRDGGKYADVVDRCIRWSN